MSMLEGLLRPPAGDRRPGRSVYDKRSLKIPLDSGHLHRYIGPMMTQQSEAKPMPGQPVTGPRPLHQIAREIRADWKNVYFGAVPYLQAMGTLSSIKDVYIAEDASSIVAYFLANAQSWRGETAKRIKKELNALLKSAR